MYFFSLYPSILRYKITDIVTTLAQSLLYTCLFPARNFNLYRLY